MKAVLSRVSDFLSDLENAMDESVGESTTSRGPAPFVRSEILSLEKAEGGFKEVRVVSSFFDIHGRFYELTLQCGKVYAGDREQEAIKVAEAAIAEIDRNCQEMGCRFGRGEWRE